MKHLLILLGAVLGLYLGWVLSTPRKRDQALGLIARHGVRIGLLVLAVLALAAASYYFSSTPILKP